MIKHKNIITTTRTALAINILNVREEELYLMGALFNVCVYANNVGIEICLVCSIFL